MEGVLEGISGRPASTADGTFLELREMGRETLRFTGMGAAVFDGFPALEAVHLDEVAEVSEGDRSDEVYSYMTMEVQKSGMYVDRISCLSGACISSWVSSDKDFRTTLAVPYTLSFEISRLFPSFLCFSRSFNVVAPGHNLLNEED